MPQNTQGEPWKHYASEKSVKDCILYDSINLYEITTIDTDSVFRHRQCISGALGLETGVWGGGWGTPEGDGYKVWDFFWG